MTEVLIRHHAAFHAMVESKMAAVGHVENLTAVLIRRWHMYSYVLLTLDFILKTSKT